jgi:hypothetical protein
MSRALSPRAGFHPSGFEDWLQASCCGVIAFSRRMRRVPRAGDVASPYGTNKKNFMAAFSNIDSEIDLSGPGFEILSTVPDGYAPLDGTSMPALRHTGWLRRSFPRFPILWHYHATRLVRMRWLVPSCRPPSRWGSDQPMKGRDFSDMMPNVSIHSAILWEGSLPMMSPGFAPYRIPP